jgi:stage III sporulation protein AB
MESHRLAMRVYQLESFLRFLSAAQTEIRFSGLPVEQIIKKHGKDLKFLKICSENFETGSGFISAWESSVNTAAKREGFNDQDIALLHNFGNGFGASDLDGQLSHCALYYELVTDELKGAKEDRTRKAKLYQMLGVFSGMAVALLLC